MSAKTADLPIVCDLSVFTQDQRKAHLDLTRKVFVEWADRHEYIDSGIMISISGNEETFLETARWASEEHLCCAWLTFSVTIATFPAKTSGRIELRLTSSSAAGVAFIGASLGQMIAQGDIAADIRRAG